MKVIQTRLDEIMDADGQQHKTRPVCSAVETTGDLRVRIEDGVGDTWEGFAEDAITALTDCSYDDYVDWETGEPYPLKSIFEALRIIDD